MQKTRSPQNPYIVDPAHCLRKHEFHSHHQPRRLPHLHPRFWSVRRRRHHPDLAAAAAGQAEPTHRHLGHRIARHPSLEVLLAHSPLRLDASASACAGVAWEVVGILRTLDEDAIEDADDTTKVSVQGLVRTRDAEGHAGGHEAEARSKDSIAAVVEHIVAVEEDAYEGVELDLQEASIPLQEQALADQSHYLLAMDH